MTKREKIYVIIVICLAAGVSLSSIDEGDTVVASPFDLFGLLSQLFEYAFLAFFCYVHRTTLLTYARYLRGPLPLALLTVASSVWSVLPSWTFRRSVGLLILTIFGYYIGALLNAEALSNIYVRAMKAMIIISLLYVVLLPKYGISHGFHGGDWKGAFFHKNRAGEMMAFAFVTFAVVTPANVSRAARWCFGALALLILYKSHAGTATAGVAIVIAAQAVWRLLMVRRKTFLAILLAGYPLPILTAWLVMTYSSTLFTLLGKDATFTGRDKVWAGVLEAIRMQPLLGYGYQSFFLEQAGKTILIRERTPFVPIHAHNGYLNLTIHIGLIGLAMFLIFLARILWLAIREGRRTHNPFARWVFSFIVLVIVENLTESQTIESPMIWITLIAFYTALSIQRASRGYEVPERDEIAANYGQLVLD